MEIRIRNEEGGLEVLAKVKNKTSDLDRFHVPRKPKKKKKKKAHVNKQAPNDLIKLAIFVHANLACVFYINFSICRADEQVLTGDLSFPTVFCFIIAAIVFLFLYPTLLLTGLDKSCQVLLHRHTELVRNVRPQPYICIFLRSTSETWRGREARTAASRAFPVLSAFERGHIT